MAIDKKGNTKTPLIGQLALKNHLITLEELQKAIESCPESNDPDTALKDYFLFEDLISSKNVKRLARVAKTIEFLQKEFKFGTLAIHKGYINKSVLILALEEQQDEIKNKREVCHIGEKLVKAGFLTEKQQDYILKMQKKVRKESAKKTQAAGEIIEDQTSDKLEKSSDENGEDTLLFEPEPLTGGIELQVSKNFMMAFFTKTEGFDENITVEEIKEALFDKGIVYGVVVDEMIRGFIKSSGFKTKSFKIAQGTPPIEGKDARVEFFFTTDYLKAGGLNEDGVIDFKDRGETPQVEKGTILAEKIPMRESKQGRNIYGDIIETVPKMDIDLKCGTGVKISEDGLKLFADVAGFPKISLSGHVFVHEEYSLQGDVDYETGHIDYNGNVNVKGRVKSGFKVKGKDIKIIAMDGGIVYADGHVRVSGGITEAEIYARGSVFAKYIHNSEISCLDDVVVTKEILDSDIECSGKCIVENGRIMTSQVVSKRGVKARNVGTDRTEPCTLKVGHDVFIKKELKIIKHKIGALDRQVEQDEVKKEELIVENRDVQKQISELARIQNRVQLEIREDNAKIAQIEETSANIETIQQLKNRIQSLQRAALEAGKKLNTCFDKSEEIEEQIKEVDKNIKSLEQSKKNLSLERVNFIQLSKDSPGQPVVTVNGRIVTGTVIEGRHCKKRITEIMRNVKIEEVLCKFDGGENLNVYQMQVKNI